ncbi:MAG: DNA-3-methyladenine glycosylase family protein [Pseudomonadota bacterium]
MTRVERVLRPRGIYSLRLTAASRDATRAWDDDAFTAAVRVGGGTELASARQRADGTLVVRAASDDGVEALRFQLALDDDHAEFLRRFGEDPLLGTAVRRIAGLRQARLGSVAQALLRAFAGQLIESRRARAIEAAIVRAATPRVGGTRLHAPPTAACLGALAPARMRRLGLHANRGAALVRICRSYDPERLRDLPTDAAVRVLTRERGLGPWSAGVVCLEGLGRTEHGLVGDLGLMKLLAALRGRWVEAWETEELLAPYGEWAGLASVYLLKGWARGLLPLPSAPPPARFRHAA